MNIATNEEPGDTGSPAADISQGDPRRMTRAQLRRLGVSQLAYLRSGLRNGEPAFAIHAADGTAMAVVEDIDLAVELVSEQGMIFVAVH
jgi:hypothetical protein